MIDPQTVDESIANPVEDPAMRVLKDLLVFHAQPDERVNVEEPSIAQVTIRAAPPRQAIVLHVEQAVQRVGIGIHLCDRAIEGRGDNRIVVEQAPQLFAQHRLVAMPSSDAGAIGCGRTGKSAEGVGKKRERVRPRLPGSTTEQRAKRARADRIRVVRVSNLELGAMAHDLNFPSLEHATVVIPEDRNQHCVAQARFGRLPLHVEVRREVTRRAVLEHVGPPPVGRGRDRHVIRDDVEHLSQASGLQCRGEAREAFLAAKLHVRSRVIDHVVAMRAAGRCLEIGRAVEMCDPQFATGSRSPRAASSKVKPACSWRR